MISGKTLQRICQAGRLFEHISAAAWLQRGYTDLELQT